MKVTRRRFVVAMCLAGTLVIGAPTGASAGLPDFDSSVGFTLSANIERIVVQSVTSFTGRLGTRTTRLA